MKIKEQTRKRAAGCTWVRQGEADVVWIWFSKRINQKNFETITVQEIIDLADVGRSTFYSHYESKELLLDELCRYL